MNNNFVNRISQFFVSYFTLSDLVPQAEAEAVIREGVTFRGTNILILIVAILIASLGLNTNSTAVIIGAMLISPLMECDHRHRTGHRSARFRAYKAMSSKSRDGGRLLRARLYHLFHDFACQRGAQ